MSEIFGNKLKKLRKEKDLTQQELANRLFIDVATYNRFEKGKRDPDFETVQKIADFFNISISELADKEEEAKKPEINQETTLDKVYDLMLSIDSKIKNKEVVFLGNSEKDNYIKDINVKLKDLDTEQLQKVLKMIDIL